MGALAAAAASAVPAVILALAALRPATASVVDAPATLELTRRQTASTPTFLTNASFSTFSNTDVAVVVVASDTTNTTSVFVQSNATGWVGVGTNASMLTASLYVGWAAPDGSSVVSQRRTVSYAMPLPVNVSDFSPAIRPPGITQVLPAIGTAALAFSIPGAPPADATLGWVYAVSTSSPVNASSNISAISVHTSKGSAVMQLYPRYARLPPIVTMAPAPTAGTSATAVITHRYCSDGGAGTGTFVCVTGVRDISTSVVTLTVETSYAGWVAVGVGVNMSAATVYAGWNSSEGTRMVSRRTATGHALPALNATGGFYALVATPPQVALRAGSVLFFSVARNMTDGSGLDISNAGPTSLIFATSATAPLFRDSPDAKFTRHDFRGTFSLDLSAPAPTASFLTNASFSTFSNADVAVVAVASDATNTTSIFVQSNATGWVGIGTNASMLTASLYVGWAAPDGSPVISQRRTATYAMPIPVDVTDFVPAVRPLGITQILPAAGTASLAFSIPGAPPEGATLGWVYAVSTSLPVNASSNISAISVHTSKGSAVMQLYPRHARLPPIVAVAPAPTAGASAAAVVIVRRFCSDGGASSAPYVCVTGVRDVSTSVVTLTVETSYTGWVAVGVGVNMSAATVYVGWNSSEGTQMVSRRTATGHALPALNTTGGSYLLVATPPQVTLRAASSQFFSIARNLTDGSGLDILSSAPSSFIYGASTDAPLFRDSPGARFTRHVMRGNFSLDLSAASGTSVSSAVTTVTISATAVTILATNSPTISATAVTISATNSPTAGSTPSTYVVQQSTVCSDASNTVCATFQVNTTDQTVAITVQCVATAWCSLGIGYTVMAGSTMYVAWTNSTGGIVLSQRKAFGHIVPTPVSGATDFELLSRLPSGVTLLPTTRFAFAFRRRLAGTSGSATLSLKAATPLIWGIGQRVTTPDSTRSTFGIHTKKGALAVNLAAAKPTTVDVNGSATMAATTSTAAAALPTATNGVASFCGGVTDTVCGSFLVASDQTVTLAIQTTAKGWAAVGVGGSTMVGPTLFLCWANSTGGSVVSQRIATSYTMPGAVTPSGFVQLPSLPTAVPVIPSTSATCALTFPAAGDAGRSLSAVSLTGATSLVWAVSSAPPSTPDTPTSAIAYHTERGAGQVTLQAATTGSAVADTTAQVNNTCVDAARTLCVAAQTTLINSNDGNPGYVTFTVQSSAAGWAAIGVNPTGRGLMAGATFYIGWPNLSGGVTLSQRMIQSGSAHAMPTRTGLQSFVQLSNPPAGVTVYPTSNIVFAFRRPIRDVNATGSAAAGELSMSGATQLIWAVSDQSSGVVSTADSSSAFSIHDQCGSFMLDVSQAGAAGTQAVVGPSADELQRAQLRLAHGVCMTLAWGVLPPVAVFVARYLKDLLGHAWFVTHATLLGAGTGALVVAGLALIEYEVTLLGVTPRFVSTTHGILGTVLCLALFPAQVLLGVLCDRLWSASRSSIPWWDQVHWWIGRASLVLVLPTVVLGVQLYGGSTTWLAAFFTYIGVVIVSFLVAEVRLGGPVHHVAGPPSPTAKASLKRDSLGGESGRDTEAGDEDDDDGTDKEDNLDPPKKRTSTH
ncbi:hypothetical protein HK405_015555 [Cladochytrium tenue]|nr:hypothetical protein HK405_015555 [Cladochytrium tenue]